MERLGEEVEALALHALDDLADDRVGGRGKEAHVRPLLLLVLAYEPGRLITFEFEPGSGLRGHHGLEIEPVGNGRARMRYVLDVEVDGIYRMVRPVFLAMHDALVEDMFDKAKLATTGRLARPARSPRWLRLANGIEVALRPRRGRLAALAVPGALVGIGGIHSAWALGWRWPGGNDAASGWPEGRRSFGEPWRPPPAAGDGAGPRITPY